MLCSKISYIQTCIGKSFSVSPLLGDRVLIMKIGRCNSYFTLRILEDKYSLYAHGHSVFSLIGRGGTLEEVLRKFLEEYKYYC